MAPLVVRLLACAGLQVAGRRAVALGPRLLLQIFWIGCLAWVAAAAPSAT